MVISAAFSFTGLEKAGQEVASAIQAQKAPVLREDASEINLTARAAYVLDISSGKVLFGKNHDEPMLPASTTKIATALVALDHYDLNQVITIGEVKVDGQKMDLVPGEEITVKNLLYGLLVFSANDAAEVLAQNYPGGRNVFIKSMNRLSSSIGLKKTHFTNPAGLDEYLHFSTAEDLATLATYAVQNPTFAEIVATSKLDVASLNGKVHELVNINQLLGKVPGVLGVKTGWTINSGESLVTFVQRDDKKLMFSLLGSSDRFKETEELINWVFTNYSWD